MTKKTVQKDIRSAVQALTRGDRNIDDGQAAIARDTAQLASAESRDVLIQNPAGSGFTVYLTQTLNTANLVTGTLKQNVDIDTEGAAVSQLNTDIADPQNNSTVTTVQQGGAYSNPAPDTLPIRTQGARGGVSATPTSSGATFVLRAGSNLLYELESQADGNDYSLEFAFVEIPI